MFLEYTPVTHYVSAQGIRDPRKTALQFGQRDREQHGNKKVAALSPPSRVSFLSALILRKLKVCHLIMPLKCIKFTVGTSKPLYWVMKWTSSNLPFFPLRIYIIFNDNTSSPSRGIRSSRLNFLYYLAFLWGKCTIT